MSVKLIFGVQTFVRGCRGSLAQGRLIVCKDAGEACKAAEEKVRLGQAIGAAAFQRDGVDPEFDDGVEPITLATFGLVPQGVSDQLPF